MKKADLSIIFSSFMFILFLFLVYQATGFQTLARYFPLAIAVVAAVVTLLDLLLQIKDRKKKSEMAKINYATIKFILWIVGYTALVFIIGFIPGTVVFIASFLKFETKFSIIKTAIITILTMAIIYVFAHVMNLYWPEGILF